MKRIEDIDNLDDTVDGGGCGCPSCGIFPLFDGTTPGCYDPDGCGQFVEDNEEDDDEDCDEYDDEDDDLEELDF